MTRRSYQHRAAVVVLSHRPALLREAIASVTKQVAPDVQLIVQHSGKCWPDKLNQAVAASDAEFVVPLCDDDLLAPRYVAECLRYAAQGDLMYTDRVHFTDAKRPTHGTETRMSRQAPRTKFGFGYRVTIDPASFAFGSPLPMTVMVRRSLWDDLGGYDGALPHADTEFLYRVIASGARIVYVPQKLFYYRNHAAQISKLGGSMNAALIAFHLKHFRDFGFTFNAVRPHADAPEKVDVDVIPPEDREAYIAQYLDSSNVAPASAWARQVDRLQSA
jgi:hypothetical protein